LIKLIELNKIYCENNLETMARMPDCFVDLTVTSPPYDGLRTYNGYSFPFEEIAKELFRVTKEGGVVVWVVGDAVVEKSETGTSFRQALFLKEIGFRLHDTMIYQKSGCSMTDKSRYFQTFEYMFVFSKGDIKCFNPLEDRKNRFTERWGKSRRARNTDGSFGDEYESKKSNQFGKRFNIWKYHQGGGYGSGDKIAHEHPAVFPEQLAADHIYSWSNEGDLVYDCFGGSGTTAKMAHLQKRNWILSEISKDYCDIAEKRIKPHLNQTRADL
jgi:site-specific DNA-methyltransferase (adenine-specific)